MVSMGSTYWAKNPYSALRTKHLYFVINNPAEDKFVILVNMTKKGNIQDNSCVLQPGEHKCISDESVINYGQALVPSLQNFQSSITNKYFTSEIKAKPKLIEKIQKGALKSQHFPDRYVNIMREILENDN